MPIVEPATFTAAGLVPFQINPHYTDAHPDGHAGETREQRLLEYVEANPCMTVAGLREWLRGCGEPYATALGNARRVRAAVNQEMAEPDDAVKAGDEVAFFPPVTGG